MLGDSWSNVGSLLRGVLSTPFNQLEMPRTLAEVAPGRSVVIGEINGSGNIVERLMIMGLVPGVAVRVTKAGDPAIIDLPGSRLAISHELLRKILIAAG